MNISQILFIVVFALLLTVVDSPCGDSWKAPKFAKDTNNPIVKLQGNEKMISLGKKLYDSNCATCHGETGIGDGSAARFLTKRPTDLNSPETQSQTDGELYWKIQTGKSPMPSFSEIMSGKKIWLTVNYLRALQK